MWRRGDVSVMENLSPSCRGRVYSSTRGAGGMYRRERQRLYGGRGMLNVVVRRCYFATAEAPDGAMLLLFASKVCCAVVVLRWTIVLVYARGTYAYSK